MDASTTALSVARQLKARGGWSQLTVITNGLRIASELAGHPGHRRPDARRPRPLGGAVGRRPARRRPVQPDQRPEGVPRRRRLHRSSPGLADATDEEAQIKRSMVAAAREVIAIVDHTKWERAAFATFCPTDRDRRRPDRRGRARRRWSQALDGRGVDVRLVGPRRPVARRRRRARRATSRGPRVTAERRAGRPRPVAARRAARHLEALRGDPGARRRLARPRCPARSTPSSARTAPARARWSRSSPASTSPTAGRSGSTASRRRSHGPAQARALGIAVVHQEPRLFPDLTVAENVFIGHAPSGRLGIDRLGRHAPRGAGRCSRSSTSSSTSARRSAACRWPTSSSSRSPSRCRSRPRVLILDEPTASLSAHEVERLFAIVRRLRDRGVVGPVRQPPARRGVRAVRPGDGLPRRPPRHHDRRRAS